MSVELPFMSVIIPTFDRPRPLNRCLDALAKQIYPTDRFEVVVVDDGGTQPLDEVVRDSPRPVSTILTRHDNTGPAGARNWGATMARGRLLAFTDDDCTPDPGWLSAFADAYRHTPNAMLGGLVRTQPGGSIYAYVSQLILDGAYDFYNKDPDNARFFASNNLAIPRDVFQAVGGFDERFRIASEDRELCYRWRSKGHRLRLVPRAVVHHRRELSFGRFLQQHFNYGRGAFQYHRERARCGSGGILREIKNQGRFLSRFLPWIRQQPLGKAAKICGLLAFWQTANVAGFLYAAVRQSTPMHQRGTGHLTTLLPVSRDSGDPNHNPGVGKFQKCE